MRRCANIRVCNNDALPIQLLFELHTLDDAISVFSFFPRVESTFDQKKMERKIENSHFVHAATTNNGSVCSLLSLLVCVVYTVYSMCAVCTHSVTCIHLQSRRLALVYARGKAKRLKN